MSGSEEPIRFTFPEAHEYWMTGVHSSLLSIAAYGLLFLTTYASSPSPDDEGWQFLMTIVVAAAGVAVSLMYSSRIAKLAPLVNQRFLIEFMFRTGQRTIFDTVDVIQGQHMVAALDEAGDTNLWSVQRKRDIFTIAPA